MRELKPNGCQGSECHAFSTDIKPKNSRDGKGAELLVLLKCCPKSHCSTNPNSHYLSKETAQSLPKQALQHVPNLG